MTFVARVDSLAARFLSDRAYELIVAPALADVEYDPAGAMMNPTRDCRSVARAFAGAVIEDHKSRGSIPLLVGLTLIPAAYYSFFLIVLAAPRAVPVFRQAEAFLVLAVAIGILSIGPVLACCWPERTPRRNLP
jgi:hypothetical protein